MKDGHFPESDRGLVSEAIHPLWHRPVSSTKMQKVVEVGLLLYETNGPPGDSQQILEGQTTSLRLPYDRTGFEPAPKGITNKQRTARRGTNQPQSGSGNSVNPSMLDAVSPLRRSVGCQKANAIC